MIWNRVITLDAGVVMVVTDLHGDGDAYARYRDRFLTLRARGLADTLILAGDLLHRTPPDPDDSLAMILDVLRLKEELGESLIYLLGNHELPHRYSFTLEKGDDLFTPRFEWALSHSMGQHRSAVMALLDSLPFYVRTRGGLAVCHAGAFPGVDERLFTLSHERILAETAVSLPPETRPGYRALLARPTGKPYSQHVHEAFAITGPDDPRYDDPLISAVALNRHPDLRLLWDALFTRNEKQYGRQYPAYLKQLLRALSQDYHPQHCLVTGHIDCQDGVTLVHKQQLRLASAKHAQPREKGLYLLWNVEEKINLAGELLAGLHSVFT